MPSGYADERDLTNHPYFDRRARLVRGVRASARLGFAVQRMVSDPADLQAFFEEAIADGCEGVMCKSVAPAAVYQAGARGWLWTVTKVGTGFSDAGLATLSKRLAAYRAAGRPARVDAKIEPNVWFEPAVVLEIIGAEITLSPVHTAGWGQGRKDAGLALRFPRFTGRYRDDKGPEDATTVAEVWNLFRSARRPS